MLGVFSIFGDLLASVTDHRFMVVAGLCVVGGVAARLYVPVAGAAIARALFVGALVFGCFDAGYSYRARVDRTAEMRNTLAQRDAALAERDRQARDAARLAEDDRLRADALQHEADELHKVIAEFELKDTAGAPEPKTVASGACLIDDSFISGLRRLDAAAGRK